MEFIRNNLFIIVLAVLAVAFGVFAVIRFIRSSREEQIRKVREWLVYATMIAEKELGGGTGQLKLRRVYDMFVGKFPWMAQVVSFERFSELVDEALGSMNKLLTTNTAVQAYVSGNTN